MGKTPRKIFYIEEDYESPEFFFIHHI
jgi:hypothetical protein